MNGENERTEQINSKIKKYSIAFGSCALIFAIFALAVNSNDIVRNDEPPIVTENRNVDAEVTNIPDERQGATMIVPATEVTTLGDNFFEVSETTEPVTAAVASAPSSFMLPLSTDVGKDYSMGVPVYNAVMADWRTHDGVDFNGALGDGVKATASGTVKDIRTDAIMGDTVVIDHGGNITASYCGVTAVDSLKKGMRVEKGDKIGELSGVPSEADAAFPHLHLEMRVDGEIADPLDVMGIYENN